MRKKKNILLTIIACTILVIIFCDLFIGLPDTLVKIEENLSGTKSKSLDVLVESTKLFTSFAVAIIGALAFVFNENRKNEKRLKTSHIWLMLISAASSVISIFFGGKIFDLIIEMLANDSLDILAHGILYAIRAQYLSIIVSLCLFVIFAFEILDNDDDSPS